MGNESSSELAAQLPTTSVYAHRPNGSQSAKASISSARGVGAPFTEEDLRRNGHIATPRRSFDHRPTAQIADSAPRKFSHQCPPSHYIEPEVPRQRSRRSLYAEDALPEVAERRSSGSSVSPATPPRRRFPSPSVSAYGVAAAATADEEDFGDRLSARAYRQRASFCATQPLLLGGRVESSRGAPQRRSFCAPHPIAEAAPPPLLTGFHNLSGSVGDRIDRTQPPPSRSAVAKPRLPTAAFVVAAPSTRTARRMSVDESQSRRRDTIAAATTIPPHSARQPSPTMIGSATQMAPKLSLAGFPPSTTNAATAPLCPVATPFGDSSARRIQKAAREFTETGDFGLSLQEQLKLSSYQTLMLTQTWPRLKSAVFSNVFRELSQKCPRVKELFQKTSIVGGFASATKCYDLREHVKLVVELFDISIQDLALPGKTTQERCIQIGETHFMLCGPNAGAMWDDLGDCLTEAISKAEPVRGKREAFKAYMALTSFLVDSMKAGYMAQQKRRALSRPSNGLC